MPKREKSCVKGFYGDMYLYMYVCARALVYVCVYSIIEMHGFMYFWCLIKKTVFIVK
jgi:hypothetical protein